MFFPPLLSAPQSALDASAYLHHLRHSCLFSSLVSRMGSSFPSFIPWSPSIHPSRRLPPGFSLSHFSFAHPLNLIPSSFHAPFLPLRLHILPFKSYLCLFSFICLSAVPSLPNSALLFLPLSCSLVKPSPLPLISCSPPPPPPYLPPFTASQAPRLDKQPRCRVIRFLTGSGSVCSDVTHSPTAADPVRGKLEV